MRFYVYANKAEGPSETFRVFDEFSVPKFGAKNTLGRRYSGACLQNLVSN